MELFKAHEGDVVVWVVHDGQTCSRDADVQSSVVRAERKQTSDRCSCSTAALHLHEVIPPAAHSQSCCLFVLLTYFSLHYLLWKT